MGPRDLVHRDYSLLGSSGPRAAGSGVAWRSPRPEEDQMTLTRISSTLGAVALGGVLVASTYGASPGTAARPPAAPAHAPHQAVARDGFVAPAPHRYGANGMRM